MRASTLGTDEKSVKFHGLRTLMPVIDLNVPLEISLDLDWNNQVNGCYLSAGLFLCPTATTENPGDEKEWIKLEYRGVPPGKNARIVISRKRRGAERWLFTEGWPEQQHLGRLIGLQHLRLLLTRDTMTVFENDRELYTCKFEGVEHTKLPLTWESAYLYLQQSSHCNYQAREGFFDNINIQPIPARSPLQQNNVAFYRNQPDYVISIVNHRLALTDFILLCIITKYSV